MKIVFLFLFFFLTSGCGYQPVYHNKNIQNLELSEIIVNGNKDINNIIISRLSVDENKNADKLYLTSLYKKEISSKNTKGQSVAFKSTIEVRLEIKNIKNEIIGKRNFIKEFIYYEKDNQFGQVEYENSIRKNLVEEVVIEIINYLNTK